MNHPSLDAANDPGGDGAGSGYPADSFAVELGYYKGDYVRSGSTLDSSASTGLRGAPLYGGNISSATAHIGKKTGARYEQLAGEVYRYDQLQRLTASDFRFYNSGTWNTTTQYATRYAYNADGDIDTLTRRAFDTMGSNKMDSLVYRYQGGGSPDNHKLIRVEDAVTGDKYVEDIGPGQTGMNYRYDRSGNLIRDEQEKMSLFWDASGKLERVERRPANNRWTIAEYTYDAGGNRVRRVLREKASNADVQVRTTFYVYDASGTVVSIYEKNCTEPSDIDGDGVLNANDNCMYTWNPGQTDSDGDGVGDECDLCPGVPNPDNADADRDGIGDACDNCMYYNPNQNDSNSNGIGDVCEAWYAGIDSDGDGMVDRVDPCPSYYNGPVWLDGDGDGIPDDCDNCPLVSNPNQKDEDHDGVGDECETAGGGGCAFTLVEQPIYGIIREGVSLPQDVTIGSLGPDTIYTRRLGEKLYELTDHLGNVRGVVSDRLLSDIVSGSPGQYRADMRRYSNLYPYGMEMPGRYYAGTQGQYRYGYNGMEQDSSSTGDHYTTYYRQYDARLGRFWSIDPVTQSGESPYAAMGGNPILRVDPLGDKDTTKYFSNGGRDEFKDDEDGNPYSVTRYYQGGGSHVYLWNEEQGNYKLRKEEESSSFLDAITPDIHWGVRKGGEFLLGFVHASGENITLTAVKGEPINTLTYQLGRVGGDIVTAIMGHNEMNVGAGMMGGSIGVGATGGGAVVAPEGVAAGSFLTVHGAAVTLVSVVNGLVDAKIALSQMTGWSSGGSGGGKSAGKEANDLGDSREQKVADMQRNGRVTQDSKGQDEVIIAQNGTRHPYDVAGYSWDETVKEKLVIVVGGPAKARDAGLKSKLKDFTDAAIYRGYRPQAYFTSDTPKWVVTEAKSIKGLEVFVFEF